MASTTKADIKAAALNLFIRQGYEPTTIRDITSSLDITPAALYYHFESKDALLLAVAEPLFVATKELMELIEPLELDVHTAQLVLSKYFDIQKDPWLTRVMVDDPAIRNHHGIASLWKEEAPKLLIFLTGDRGEVGRIRATTALGCIRRSLELPGIDRDECRDSILGVALSILKLSTGPSQEAMDERNRILNDRLARTRVVAEELNTIIAEAEAQWQIYSSF
jgi:AcrR family transcriptional regulator